jgi:hypothetical protein
MGAFPVRKEGPSTPLPPLMYPNPAGPGVGQDFTHGMDGLGTFLEWGALATWEWMNGSVRASANRSDGGRDAPTTRGTRGRDARATGAPAARLGQARTPAVHSKEAVAARIEL